MAIGLLRYYFVNAAIFLFLAIYCAQFKSEFKSDVCYAGYTTTTTANATVNATSNSSALSNVTSTIESALNLKLTTIPGVLTGFYAAEFSLSVLSGLILYYFLSFVPKDFASIGRFRNLLGLFLKLFPKLIIFLHYIILIIICAQIGYVGGGKCKNAKHLATDGTQTTGAMERAGIIMIIILSALWIVQHIGGAVMRSILNVDPFLAEPDDPSSNRIYAVICKKCGP